MPIETNLLRKGIVRVGRGSAPINTRDLLGTAKASTPLALTDLDVLGWLSSRLLRDDAAVVFSREELAVDLFGRDPGGRERTLVRESLDRLASVRLTLGGYDARSKATDLDAAFEDVGILRALDRRRATGYATPTWKVEFAEWLLEQIAYGYVTYADWASLRSLRGLQKRLWLYFEAEPRDAFWVSLGARGLTSLGVASRSTRAARGAIMSAVGGPGRSEGLDRYHASIRRTRVGDRLYVRRLSREGDKTLFEDEYDWRSRKAWVRMDRPVRRAEQAFDPTTSLIASKAPGGSGVRRNLKDGMAQQPRSGEPRILVTGQLPRDQIDLLLWMREEAHGLDQIVVLLSDAQQTLQGVHNPSCPDLDVALEDAELDGIFVAAGDPKPLKRWFEQHSMRKPPWCLSCRARFHDRADAP